MRVAVGHGEVRGLGRAGIKLVCAPHSDFLIVQSHVLLRRAVRDPMYWVSRDRGSLGWSGLWVDYKTGVWQRLNYAVNNQEKLLELLKSCRRRKRLEDRTPTVPDFPEVFPEDLRHSTV
ncbi:hypothetical protein Tco_0446449 [Tanacetum coccineum]